MAYLYIEEYSDIREVPLGANGDVDPIATQRVAVGATSAQSSALNTATNRVVLTADVACQWAHAANPTASSTGRYLHGGIPRAFRVTGGNKIAVIEDQA